MVIGDRRLKKALHDFQRAVVARDGMRAKTMRNNPLSLGAIAIPPGEGIVSEERERNNSLSIFVCFDDQSKNKRIRPAVAPPFTRHEMGGQVLPAGQFLGFSVIKVQKERCKET